MIFKFIVIVSCNNAMLHPSTKLILTFQLSNIHHENLNPFIGAALQDNDIYILTNYCPRGSLQVIHSVMYTLKS